MAGRLLRICRKRPVHVGLFDQCQRVDAIEYDGEEGIIGVIYAADAATEGGIHHKLACKE